MRAIEDIDHRKILPKMNRKILLVKREFWAQTDVGFCQSIYPGEVILVIDAKEDDACVSCISFFYKNMILYSEFYTKFPEVPWRFFDYFEIV